MWNPTKEILDANQSQKKAELGPKRLKIATTAKKSKSQKTKILKNESYQWTLKKLFGPTPHQK